MLCGKRYVVWYRQDIHEYVGNVSGCYMSEHCCSWFDANIDLDSKELFIDEMIGYLADSDLYTCMEDYYYYWNATAKHIIEKNVNLIL